MQRFQSSNPLPPAARGAAFAIGNFDGVHLGHQAVLDATRGLDAPLGVLTFEPHPRAYFAAQRGLEQPPFRLMDANARAARLAKLGVDVLVEVPFDAALSERTAEAFVADILDRQLGASHVVTGADFQFGKGRSGDATDLARLCAARGISARQAPLLALDGIEVSSTRIRTALSDGRPRDAAAMLGHWHRIEGRVAHGHKRGRELGYPTANLEPEGLHLPKFGVYATRVDVRDGPHAGSYLGATSIGERPHFGSFAPNVETYLLDFTGDLYGADISVALVEFLRGEATFDDLDGLLVQMAADVEQARAVLSDA
ncbi:MAG: bifunctional riboflavin kinase/FAD synthetase [Shimia sp.]